MKSFELSSRQCTKAAIVTGIFFGLMAFKDPDTPKKQAQIFQPKTIKFIDTVPKMDVNINIDLGKIMANVNEALAKIDFKKIGQDIQLSLNKIDFAKMQEDINQSLKSIDWDKMNKDIQNSLKNLDDKKIKIEIENSLNEAKKNMNIKEFKEKMQKLKDTNMKDMKEQLKKAQLETQKSMEQLKKELQRLKEEYEQRDAVLLDPFEMGRDCVILI